MASNWCVLTLPMYNNSNSNGISVNGMKRMEGEKLVMEERKEGENNINREQVYQILYENSSTCNNSE